MGLEKWLHKQFKGFMKDDKEYLLVIIGLAGIALFLYAVLGNN